MIIFILQISGFLVFAIIRADSILFRLIGMFVGIGLVIVPVLLRGLISDSENSKKTALILDTIFSVYLILGPWMRIEFLFGMFPYYDLPNMAIANACIPLSAACLGFAVLGFIIALKSKPYDGDSIKLTVVIKILRLLISAILLAAGLYVMYPMLGRIVPTVRTLGIMNVGAGTFAGLIVRNAGNPWVWFANLAVSTCIYFTFYKRWIVDGEV